jgi:hypothetical protein
VQRVAVEGRVLDLHIRCIDEYARALDRAIPLDQPSANNSGGVALEEIRPTSANASAWAVPYGVTCVQCHEGGGPGELRPYRCGNAEPWIWLHQQCVRFYAREHRGE